MTSHWLLALDVGEKRIGVATADATIKIAMTKGTLTVDDEIYHTIAQMIDEEQATTVVVGYPRNQSGDPTAQTAVVEAFVEKLRTVTNTPIVYQDESLTSVKAEETLRRQKRPYAKADIDTLAASYILQDYLEAMGGRH